MDNLIGKEILNYRIVSFVGKGGMGSVYLGIHKYINEQKVAIKVIDSTALNDFTREILAGEAKSLASLNHQNIVHFHNFHIDDEGYICLIMEFAEGISLDNYLEKVSGPIVEDRICDMFDQILDAFGYAHQHNIIHCDIKPSNIMITPDGMPKVLDFGIAKIIKGGESDKNGYIMGTPSYMSPEQVKGGALSVASDIYSIGVLLSQMLTGKAPYNTTTLTEHEIYSRVVEQPLPRMKTYYEYVSDEMQAVVDKATAKDPHDRYQSCSEMKEAIHKVLKDKKKNSIDEKVAGDKKPVGKNRTVLIACAVSAVVVIAIVIVSLVSFSKKSEKIRMRYVSTANRIDSLTAVGDVFHIEQLIISKSLVDSLSAYEIANPKYVEEWSAVHERVASELVSKIDDVVSKLTIEADSKMNYAVFDDDYRDAIKVYQKILMLKDDSSIKRKISEAENCIKNSEFEIN